MVMGYLARVFCLFESDGRGWAGRGGMCKDDIWPTVLYACEIMVAQIQYGVKKTIPQYQVPLDLKK